jgi:hypothetical protein
MFSVNRLLALFCLIAAANCAEATVVSGRVVDQAGHGVAHARVRAFHDVPTIEVADPRNPTWNGLLGESYSDVSGHFTLRTSRRASLDYLLAEGRGYFAVVRSPLPATVRVVLRRKILSPSEHLKQLLKRIHRQTPHQTMLFRQARGPELADGQRTPKAFGVADLVLIRPAHNPS